MQKRSTFEVRIPPLWNRRSCCFTLVLLLLSARVFAQSQNVTGQVTDPSNNPIPGVNIIVKGTTSGTTTDVDGRYSINIEGENQTLIFSFIGYAAQEVPVENRSVIDITLQSDERLLEEVVVVGYGTLQKRDLTGAVSQVKAAKLENENPNAVQDILRGNIAGLNVGFSTSAKGGGSLQVRGKQSLNANSSPLLVLDGAIYYGELSDINPNDIESVDVLKDGSSAAVFGAKAAAGVILITTKRGTGRRGLGVEFNSNYVLETTQNLTDFQKTHGTGGMVGPTLQTQVAQKPTNIDNHWNSWWGLSSWGPRFDGTPIVHFDGITRQPDNALNVIFLDIIGVMKDKYISTLWCA